MYVWLNTLTIKVISWKTTWWILLLPVLDDAFWRVPTCPDAFWRIPTRPDAFWRILTHCDGLWCVATCRRLGPLYLFKFWAVGWWITWFISSWEENNCCQRWANSQNDNYFQSKTFQNSHFKWICSSITTVCFSSVWIKSCDSSAKWSKLEHM